MTVTDMITPDIAPLLPTDALVQARGRVLAAELGRRSSPGARARSPRAPSIRSLAALGVIAAIAGVAALELSDGGVVSQAQAFPVFGTPHLTPQEVKGSILGSFLKSQGSVPGNPTGFDGPYWQEAASHAYAFSTYWGTGYTFEKYDRATGYTVCSIYPDYQTRVIPDHGGWVGGCSTGATLAEAAAGWQTVRDPNGLEFVQLVPAGTTAQVTQRSAPAKAAPVQNGVLSVRVTSPATLTVHSGSVTQTHQLDPGAQPLGSTSSTFPVPNQPGGHASSASGGRVARAHASSQP